VLTSNLTLSGWAGVFGDRPRPEVVYEIDSA
jgi:hypothetical protein